MNHAELEIAHDLLMEHTCVDNTEEINLAAGGRAILVRWRPRNSDWQSATFKTLDAVREFALGEPLPALR